MASPSGLEVGECAEEPFLLMAVASVESGGSAAAAEGCCSVRDEFPVNGFWSWPLASSEAASGTVCSCLAFDDLRPSDEVFPVLLDVCSFKILSSHSPRLISSVSRSKISSLRSSSRISLMSRSLYRAYRLSASSGNSSLYCTASLMEAVGGVSNLRFLFCPGLPSPAPPLTFSLPLPVSNPLPSSCLNSSR